MIRFFFLFKYQFLCKENEDIGFAHDLECWHHHPEARQIKEVSPEHPEVTYTLIL
jgi:hypothetical protein